MEEVWKDIKGYEGLYQISNLGRVKSILFKNNRITKAQNKIMKPQVRNNYFIINLNRNGKRKQYSVHRLVAQEFIENPNNYNIVNHLDFNTFNNKANNLAWCTQKENVNYSKKNMVGKMHYFKGKIYGIHKRKKTGKYEVTIKKEYLGSFYSLEEAIKKREEKLNEINNASR